MLVLSSMAEVPPGSDCMVMVILGIVIGMPGCVKDAFMTTGDGVVAASKPIIENGSGLFSVLNMFIGSMVIVMGGRELSIGSVGLLPIIIMFGTSWFGRLLMVFGGFGCANGCRELRGFRGRDIIDLISINKRYFRISGEPLN